MAVLPDTAREELWAELMRQYSRDGETVGVTKVDLRAAVDAIDTYLHTNAAAINSTLPDAARLNLTPPQKALLMVYVIQKRYLEGV